MGSVSLSHFCPEQLTRKVFKGIYLSSQLLSYIGERRKRIDPRHLAEYYIGKDEDPPGFEVKIFPGKGRGVVTTCTRKRGDFLLQYTGEMISSDEGERREKKGSSGYSVDATQETGRLGRLVNHDRREQNAVIKEISGSLVLFCVRDIEIGEELTYDYGLKELPWEKGTKLLSKGQIVDDLQMQVESKRKKRRAVHKVHKKKKQKEDFNQLEMPSPGFQDLSSIVRASRLSTGSQLGTTGMDIGYRNRQRGLRRNPYKKGGRGLRQLSNNKPSATNLNETKSALSLPVGETFERSVIKTVSESIENESSNQSYKEIDANSSVHDSNHSQELTTTTTESIELPAGTSTSVPGAEGLSLHPDLVGRVYDTDQSNEQYCSTLCDNSVSVKHVTGMDTDLDSQITCMEPGSSAVPKDNQGLDVSTSDISQTDIKYVTSDDTGTTLDVPRGQQGYISEILTESALSLPVGETFERSVIKTVSESIENESSNQSYKEIDANSSVHDSNHSQELITTTTESIELPAGTSTSVPGAEGLSLHPDLVGRVYDTDQSNEQYCSTLCDNSVSVKHVTGMDTDLDSQITCMEPGSSAVPKDNQGLDVSTSDISQTDIEYVTSDDAGTTLDVPRGQQGYISEILTESALSLPVGETFERSVIKTVSESIENESSNQSYKEIDANSSVHDSNHSQELTTTTTESIELPAGTSTSVPGAEGLSLHPDLVGRVYDTDQSNEQYCSTLCDNSVSVKHVTGMDTNLDSQITCMEPGSSAVPKDNQGLDVSTSDISQTDIKYVTSDDTGTTLDVPRGQQGYSKKKEDRKDTADGTDAVEGEKSVLAEQKWFVDDASMLIATPIYPDDSQSHSETETYTAHNYIEDSADLYQESSRTLTVVKTTNGFELQEEHVSDSELSDTIEVQNAIPLDKVLITATADSTTDETMQNSEDSCRNDIRIQEVGKSEKRDYDKKQSCYFCNKEVLKIARHLEHCHKDVQEIATLPKFSKANKETTVARTAVFAKYRNLGNFNSNIQVLRDKRGTFHVGRRPSTGHKYSVSNFLPCQYCLTFFLRHELWRHVKHCQFKHTKISYETSEQEKKELIDSIKEGESLMQGALGAAVFTSPEECQQFQELILNSLRNDDVSRSIKSDHLLLLFGKTQFNKLGRLRAGQVREKLRILGRLKLEIRSLTKKESASIDEFITIDLFDTCIKAIKCIGGICDEPSLSGTKTYHKPSVALKAGQFLKKVAGMKRGQAIRRKDSAAREEAEGFIELYKEDFTMAISSVARQTLSERKFNKKVVLPLTEDLLKYVEYLETRMTGLTSIVLSLPSTCNWQDLAEVTLARVLCFNKRRSNEAARVLVDQYQTRPRWIDENSELVQSLQPIEKNLMKIMDLVEVLGKNGKRVPVLLTKTMVAAIDALVIKRTEAGVASCNPYVFAQGDFNHMKGSDCFRKTTRAAQLQYPERITTTKLRKYLATVSQLFKLSSTELEELARHMGHELSVHRSFYRLQEDVIELAKVSRLLIAVEEGRAHNFVGCSLDDINVADIEIEDDKESRDTIQEIDDVLETDDDDSDILDVNNVINTDTVDKHYTTQEKVRDKHTVNDVMETDAVENDDYTLDREHDKRKVRTKWSEQEKWEIKNHLLPIVVKMGNHQHAKKYYWCRPTQKF